MSDDTPAKTDNPFPAEPDREDVIAALQARERFLAGILGGLESFFTVDSEWRCTFANEAGAGLAGVSAGELLGSDLREFIPLAARDEVCARLGVAMSERVRTAVEDSDRRMYAAYPLADGGIAVYVRETTALDGAEAAQRHAAEALRESEERYQLLHDTMFQGVVYQEADGAIISMNPAAERILGKRPEDFLGSTSVGEEHYTLREDGTCFPGVEHPAMVALRSGQPVPDVLMQVYNPRESQYRLISVQAVPLFHPGEERPYQVYTVFDDVTERRQAEAALRESEEIMRSFYDSAPFLMGVARVEGGKAVQVSGNRAMAAFLGVDPADMAGRSGVGLADAPGFERAIAEACGESRAGRYPAHFEQAFDRDGEPALLSFTVARVPTRDGEQRFFSLVGEDVTLRRRAQQELRDHELSEAAQEERARLARDLHDSVTQALFAATIKAEALTLAESTPSDVTSRLAEDVRRLSRGALAQMRTLLLELRGDPLEDVPLQQLLRHLVEAAESRASVNVQLSIRGDAQLPPELHVPIYRITQEALNNVTRHAGAAKAWVDLDAEPRRVRLVVGDDGSGFEPSGCDPTHIGLKSMRERAEEAGARFDLASEPGGGTLITVDWQAS